MNDLSQTLAAIPLDWDEWEMDDDLRIAARVSQGAGASSFSSPPETPTSASPAPAPVAAARAKSRTATPSGRAPLSHAFSWTVISLSLMAFVCGAVLVGWSLFSDRAELWRLGMPLTLVGQTGWLIGLVFLFDSLWQGQRRTAKVLEEFDERLDEVQHAAALLTASRSGAAQSFYAHLAEGASPQLLLADLKGQLDLLALQLDKRRAA